MAIHPAVLLSGFAAPLHQVEQEEIGEIRNPASY